MTTMHTGDRVRYSGYALQAPRDYWLSLGDYRRKSAAKAAYDAQVALRGTVLETDGQSVRVRWDNGSESQCLTYRVEVTT
jgi:hypothetical protein